MWSIQSLAHTVCQYVFQNGHYLYFYYYHKEDTPNSGKNGKELAREEEGINSTYRV